MDYTKWYFIVNPAASGTRLKLAWEKIALQLQRLGLEFDVVFTNEKGHAITLARNAVYQGYRRIVGVGGDGTNNEIINGLLTQELVDPLELIYTLLPFGTGNDWSRTHRIPKNPLQWFKMLKDGKKIEHSAGKIVVKNNATSIARYFINIAGFAYDAHIVKISEEYPNKHRRKSLYLWLVFKCLFNFTSPNLKININGVAQSGKYYTVNCGVCKHSGGGMMLLPQANPTGDELGITLVKDFPKWKVPFATPKLFSGAIASFKYAEVTKGKTINIEAEHPDELAIEVDGEYLGFGSVEITIIPNAINIIVP